MIESNIFFPWLKQTHCIDWEKNKPQIFYWSQISYWSHILYSFQTSSLTIVLSLSYNILWVIDHCNQCICTILHKKVSNVKKSLLLITPMCPNFAFHTIFTVSSRSYTLPTRTKTIAHIIESIGRLSNTDKLFVDYCSYANHNLQIWKSNNVDVLASTATRNTSDRFERSGSSWRLVKLLYYALAASTIFNAWFNSWYSYSTKPLNNNW